MKLNQIEYRKIIERLAPQVNKTSYDDEFECFSNTYDDMSYRENIELIEKLMKTSLNEDDRAILNEWHERYMNLNDKLIFDSVMRHIGKAFNMREICDMALVPYQSYRNYKSTGKGLSYDNMRKLTAKMGGISRYVNDIVNANK